MMTNFVRTLYLLGHLSDNQGDLMRETYRAMPRTTDPDDVILALSMGGDMATGNETTNAREAM